MAPLMEMKRLQSSSHSPWLWQKALKSALSPPR